MKFFIKRRSEFIKKAAFGSALLMVSAFAVFNQEVNAATPGNDKIKEADKDSVFSARYVFERIHTSALEILPPSIRLDMLDYWDVDSIYKASNAMEGLSWLEKVNKDYLKVHISPVSTYEIRILPGKKEKLIMTVYTVGDDVQAQDSQINFYNTEFVELPSNKFLVMPKIQDFFEIPKGSATKMKEIESMIPFPTIAFSANPDNDNLEARLTVEKFVNEDDWNIAKLFVKPAIILEWKKDKFKIAK